MRLTLGKKLALGLGSILAPMLISGAASVQKALRLRRRAS